MSKYTLTENEIRALDSCLNYDDLQQQLDDNYSNGSVEQFMSTLNWSANQVKGLISSLVQKGMLEKPCEEDNGVIWITEKGVRAVFDHQPISN